MIAYNRLLSERSGVSVFWRTVLERVSIRDAPFFSKIKGDLLFVHEQAPLSLETASARRVIQFCKEGWDLPDSLSQWKDIKKESTRNLLIRKYAKEHSGEESPETFALKLQVMINEKAILPDNISLFEGQIVAIKTKDEKLI